MPTREDTDMATWGDFISEFKIVNLHSQGMFVKVDDVLTLWEERNQLRQEAGELREALAVEREGCARELDEFAEACAAEAEASDEMVAVLRAAAGLVRARGSHEAEDAPEPAVPADDAGDA